MGHVKIKKQQQQQNAICTEKKSHENLHLNR